MTGGPIFIINPKSHKVKRRGSVLAELAKEATDHTVVEFTGDRSLTPILAPHLDRGPGALFVEGGDGTVLATLTACLAHRPDGKGLPRLGILPGGSTNLAHARVGIQRSSVKGLRRRLQSADAPICEGLTALQRTLLIETANTEAPYAGFLLSTGSLSRAMLYTQTSLHRKRRGGLSIVRAILQLGLFPKSTRYTDGEPVVRPSAFQALSAPCGGPATDHAFSLFSTFDTLSLGLRPFWGRGHHAIGFTQGTWPVRRLRTGIAKLVTGQPGERLEAHGLSSRGCSEMTFACEGPVVLDGEELPMPADRIFKVSASPQLTFLR
ncbi:MAG: diacylglycerol kinase family protein [Pseudomonadota bacterium]